jgi:hypothetical protein
MEAIYLKKRKQLLLRTISKRNRKLQYSVCLLVLVCHSKDVHYMSNLDIHGFIYSRDDIWLGKLNKDWISQTTTAKYDLDNEDDEK